MCCDSPGSSSPGDPALGCSAPPAAPALPFGEGHCRAGAENRSQAELLKDRRSKLPDLIFTFHITHGIKELKIKATASHPTMLTHLSDTCPVRTMLTYNRNTNTGLEVIVPDTHKEAGTLAVTLRGHTSGLIPMEFIISSVFTLQTWKMKKVSH